MSISRRNFIKYSFLTGMSVTLGACQLRQVEHSLVSQYQMPEYKLPGQPLYWATSCGECSGGCGIAAKTADNRLIKLEGIPEHPINKGKLCARGASAIQDVYHPGRVQTMTKEWTEVLPKLASQLNKDSKPVWVVKDLHGTRGSLLVELAQKAGAKIWVTGFPDSVTERRVMKAVYGKAELPHYKLEVADYAVAFGGDFLNNGNSPVYSGWAYGQFRRGRNRQRGTFVGVSSRMNMTHANSDRWLVTRPGTEGWVALGVGNLLAAKGKGPWPAWAKAITMDQVVAASGLEQELIERLADRLATAKAPLIIADSDAGNYVNGVDSLFIIHSLGKMLGGPAQGTYEPDLLVNGTAAPDKGMVIGTKEALELASSGNCKVMWVFDVDPLRTLPNNLKAEEAFKKVPTVVAFASIPSLTSTKVCKPDNVLPVQMWLEEWGDRRVVGDGWDVYNVQQPVVNCQFGKAKSIDDILMYLKTGDLISAGIVAAGAPAGDNKGKFFRDLIRAGADDKTWETLLARGGAFKDEDRAWEHYPNRISEPPVPPANPGKAPKGVSPYAALEPLAATAFGTQGSKGLTVVPSATLALQDGSLGHRPWLQELPDPITTVVWGSWVEINSEIAKEMEIERHDLVEIALEGGGTLTAPAFPSPAIHRDLISIPIGDTQADFSKWASDRNGGMDFGQGNELYGPYGFTNKGYGKAGVNPIHILKGELGANGEPSWIGSGASIKKVGKKEMITAMDARVFNLPRQVLPLD